MSESSASNLNGLNFLYMAVQLQAPELLSSELEMNEKALPPPLATSTTTERLSISPAALQATTSYRNNVKRTPQRGRPRNKRTKQVSEAACACYISKVFDAFHSRMDDNELEALKSICSDDCVLSWRCRGTSYPDW